MGNDVTRLTLNNWNSYLWQYKDKYKVYRESDGIATIKLSIGKMMPFSVKNQLLLIWGTYTSPRAKNANFKRIKKKYVYAVLQLDCETEHVITIPISKIDEIIGDLKPDGYVKPNF